MAMTPQMMQMAQQAMMAQQMQMQMMQMMGCFQDQQQQQQSIDQAPAEPKGKGKSKASQPKKELEVPAALRMEPEKYAKLVEFMDSYDFNEHHKERLMAAMVTRMDTFMPDLETLAMAMGGARKEAGGSEAALLVALIKQIEDGEFKPRDEKDRALFRRAKEIKEEAIAANAAIKNLKQGSVRERFLAQQRAAAKETECNRQPSPRGKGRGRSGSRSRSRGNRGRSRSFSRDRRDRRGRSRSNSRGRRPRDRR